MFDELIKKQNLSTLTHDDKIKMEKFIYEKTFKVNNIDNEFMKKYYRKLHIVHNIKYLFNDNDIKVKSFDDMYSLKYEKINKLEQKKIICELIEKLGFKLEDIKNNKTKPINKETMEKLSKDMSGWFTKYNFQLFELSKKKIDTIKAFMGTLNSIFNNFGIDFIVVRKTTREKNKYNIKCFYNLIYDSKYIF
jgi:hypothetical protein